MTKLFENKAEIVACLAENYYRVLQSLTLMTEDNISRTRNFR